MTKRHILTDAVPLSLAALTYAGGETVIYVDADATGDVHDGSSWCDAFLTLHEALGAATAGTVIRVATGTYTPDPTGANASGDENCRAHTSM
ncbi:MAG: hypothetical protein PVI86_08960 [Phycisphaerae bacterium]|jgi:hypothetical protein